jgi:23S rRNA pseudouridine1911/1915/1917 synthase
VSTLSEPQPKVENQHARPAAFRVIAETPALVVVDKPAFMHVHPSKPGHVHTLWHQLRELLAYELVCGGQISIINRLDRETSGLVLVAKTLASARELHQRMKRHEFAKEYLAIVWGWPNRDAWEVNAPLLRQGERMASRIYLKRMVHPEGAPARSHFEVLQRFQRSTSAGERFSLICAVPITGRTHQLRVHLAHSGHPIVGDKIYGPDEGCYLEFIETGWTAALESRLLWPRHALHASGLRLTSEVNGAWSAPLPDDFRDFLGSSFQPAEFSRGAKNLSTESPR